MCCWASRASHWRSIGADRQWFEAIRWVHRRIG
jgi:hypothetical protein